MHTDTSNNTDKHITVLAIELFNDAMLKSGETVRGSSFINASIKASVSHLKEYLPKKSLLYSHSANIFLAVIPDHNYEQDQQVLVDLCNNLKVPMLIEGLEYLPNPRIGYTSELLQGNEDSKELIRRALSALRIVRNSREPFAKYLEEESERLKKNFKMMADLPQALASDDQIFLNFQPIITTHAQECVELECLLRWQHPELGPVSPFALLSWIEETPLMQDITLKVIELVGEAAQYLKTKGHTPKLAANLSACDLYFDKIYEKIAQVSASMLPGQLIVEITETAMIENLQTLTQQVNRLMEMGLRIHVDDFGVGQSSLSYLTSLPAQAIKLDQSFLRQIDRNPANIKVASGITTIAKELGYEVILEGVEFEEDSRIAQFISPNYMQGYAISRPLTLEKIADWLSEAG